jgi:hypothetical protein
MADKSIEVIHRVHLTDIEIRFALRDYIAARAQREKKPGPSGDSFKVEWAPKNQAGDPSGVTVVW